MGIERTWLWAIAVKVVLALLELLAIRKATVKIFCSDESI